MSRFASEPILTGSSHSSENPSVKGVPLTRVL